LGFLSVGYGGKNIKTFFICLNIFQTYTFFQVGSLINNLNRISSIEFVTIALYLISKDTNHFSNSLFGLKLKKTHFKP